tara:strand:+ start:821 stop:1066 length:246 start_codon:yes stop_codon:yes gene_type:complete
MSHHHTQIYMVVANADVTDEMVAASQETSRDTLRHSVQSVDRVILKYDPILGHPAVFDGITKYSHPDIIAILAESDWTEVE